MEVQGYSPVIILLVLGIGIPLAVLRPYYAFLFALLVVTAGNVARFNQTRMPGLGPVMNMSDSCLAVMLGAFFFDRIARKKPVHIPQVVGLLLLVTTIGALQSFWKLGWTYETFRAYRWALDLPVGFLLGANMVTTSQRTRRLILTLLVGSILSAGQHVLFAASLWHSMSLSMDDYAQMRSISYGGMAVAFLIATAVWRFPRTVDRQAVYLIIGTIFLASIFLNQTRSVWVPMVATVPCLMVLFGGRYLVRQTARLGLMFCLVILVFAVAIQRAMPGISPGQLVAERFEVLASADPQLESHTGTRKRDFQVEMGEWWKGTLVFGRGLWFFQTIENPAQGPGHIAFAHLGYITYTAQLGIIGLLVYGIWLPWSVLCSGRRLWHRAVSPPARYLAVFGTGSIIYVSIEFMMSGSFLAAGSCVVGVVYGGMWALAHEVARNDCLAAVEAGQQVCLGSSQGRFATA
jgi:hypothetical protein